MSIKDIKEEAERLMTVRMACNTWRAQVACQALILHSTVTGTLGQESLDTQVGDLICNLFHLMNHQRDANNPHKPQPGGVDVCRIIDRSKRCYEDEVSEEEEAQAADEWSLFTAGEGWEGP